jgi:hypothetical protein
MLKSSAVVRRSGAIGAAALLTACGSGGSMPAVTPAAHTTRPLTTAHFTINPTLLKHASSQRRSPAFLDTNASGALQSLVITAQSSDGVASPVTTIPLLASAATAPVQIAVPLYGPGGFIEVKEFSQALSSIGVPIAGSSVLLADSDFLNATNGNQRSSVSYKITPGADSIIALITLNAVIGGFVFSSTPDASGTTMFVPNGLTSSPTFSVNFSDGVFYTFPADALGNFSTTPVAGGFPNPVRALPVLSTDNPFQVASFGGTIAPTVFPNAFVLTSTGCGPSLNRFEVTDALGNIGSTVGSDTNPSAGGFLQLSGGLEPNCT